MKTSCAKLSSRQDRSAVRAVTSQCHETVRRQGFCEIDHLVRRRARLGGVRGKTAPEIWTAVLAA